MDQTTHTIPGSDPLRPAQPASGDGAQPTITAETAATVPAETWPAGSRGTPGNDLLTGCVWGDFLVGPLLGRGGMGAVYRGRQRSLDRDVAIKVLPPHLSDNEGFRNRFQLEAKAVASLDSPHIIKVYGAGEADGHHYFAMEYVEGQDLSQALKKLGRPANSVALDWVLQAARGLQAAGDLGIIHRDIKPANMMLTKRGVLKLMDFGLVRSTKEAHGLTMTGTVMGTVSYFSPEQGRGERCDCRTDLYALGVVFYELLTGRLPFTGEDPTSIIYQHIHVAPTPPREIDPNISEDFQSVVLKCLQKRAEDRYQTATELLADLERLVRGDHPNINAAEMARLIHGTTLYVPGQRAQRRLAPWILAGTAVTIAAATAVWLTRHPQNPEPLPPTPSSAPLANLPQSIAPNKPATLVSPIAAESPPSPPPVGALPQTAKPLEFMPSPNALATADIREQLAAGQFQRARETLAAEQAAHPAATGASAIATDIDHAEGSALLAQAQGLLNKGELGRADEPLARARALLGTSPEVVALSDALKQRIGDVERLLTQAQTWANAGHREEAFTTLAQAKLAAPNWPAIAVTERNITSELTRQAELLTQRDAALKAGAEAFAAGDLSAAEAAYIRAQDCEPSNLAAADGRRLVSERRALIANQQAALATALKQKNLAEAEATLAVLLPLVPAAARKEPQSHVEALRTQLADDARQATERELRASSTAKLLLAAAQDPQVALAELTADMAAFRRDTGGQRPEQAQLDAALAARQQREAFIDQLQKLDQAVMSGDRARVDEMVSDTAFAAALVSLSTQKELLFVTTLAQFSTNGEGGRATLNIRNSFATFPETTLHYACELRRVAGQWTITAAHLQP